MEPFKSILVDVDATATAHPALDRAIRLAERPAQRSRLPMWRLFRRTHAATCQPRSRRTSPVITASNWHASPLA